jgi:hypothetical protein
MQDLPARPHSPKQLQMQFDSTRLRGMSPLERQQTVTRLAILLTEATGAAEPEWTDDGRGTSKNCPDRAAAVGHRGHSAAGA